MSDPLDPYRRNPPPVQLDLSVRDRLRPGQRRAIAASEAIAQIAGATAAVLRYGLEGVSGLLAIELGSVVVASLVVLTVTLVLRFAVSLARESFGQRHRFSTLLLGTWWGISAAILVFGAEALGFHDLNRFELLFAWSDVVIVLWAMAATVGTMRGMSARGLSPAMMLVGTFAAFSLLGTLLLLLPNCRVEDAPDQPWPDRLRIAAFTATSACCVNGLTVVPTGGPDAYWSRTGQAIILCMIQIGGLGIMTCGAFFALTTGRSLMLRETATLRELFDSSEPINIRRLLFAILAFTFGTEIIGAILISGLWSDLPAGEQAFYSAFHAINGFCNAGFDLTGHSFIGLGDHWQVWGVIPVLIILGGLGFGVIYNLMSVAWSRLWSGGAGRLETTLAGRLTSGRPTRLTVTSRLVLLTTAALLVVGTAWHYLIESHGGIGADAPHRVRLADAWFQSVTYRSGGFTTVDLSELRTTSKLFAVVLMFIGGAPVSCAGGVKVTAVALAVLAMSAILRGRRQAEAFGRAIPDEVVKRALTIIAIGVTTVTTVALLLTAFEESKDIPLADLLFEAASACGTVGASTGITARLSAASQDVLILAIFFGRVGPLTLLLSLAGGRQTVDYDFPEERVTLG